MVTTNDYFLTIYIMCINCSFVLDCFLGDWGDKLGYFPFLCTAGILNGHSCSHLHDWFGSFKGGPRKKGPFFSSGMFSFLIAFTCLTVAFASFTNSSPNNIGAAVLKFFYSSAMNFKNGFNFNITFLCLSLEPFNLLHLYNPHT